MKLSPNIRVIRVIRAIRAMKVIMVVEVLGGLYSSYQPPCGPVHSGTVSASRFLQQLD